MKAYWRDDLEESGEMPTCSEKITFDEWASLDFEIIDNPCENWETDEGFDMILKHPITQRLLFVCSIDFNFAHYKPIKS